jgi:amino acid transporter
VIAKYTSSGGAYIVARENLGTFWSIVAAVALILDYIVTVAVQSASGVVALVSYFTSLTPYIVPITIGVILLLTYGNLRGVKEAGKSFAAPTYLFVLSMFVVFGFGIYHEFKGNMPHLATSGNGLFTLGHSQGLLTIASVFILLRAFANGGSSLTGLEAISNGVSLFQAPEGRNARRTMNIMSGLLGTLVFGVSWFAHSMHVVPYTAGAPSVVSLIAQGLVGAGLFGKIWFAFTQFSTMLILIAGANTVYNAFPILAANIARDGFLPRQLSKRGHKLVFSNGIILASLFAIGLILFTNGSVNALVALYALGVFTAFTITGIGMVVNARREKGKLWRVKALISGLAAATSLIVVIIFATVKFTEGAWLIVVTGPTLVVLMYRFSIKYREEREVLAVSRKNERATSISRHDVTVLVDTVDVATLATIRYARSLKSRHLHAVHFVIDDERAERIKKAWDSSPAVEDISLEFIDCPDRRLANTAVDYAIRATAQEDVELTLILPRRSYSRFMGRLLHDQTAEDIAGSVSQLSRVVATIVPFDVEKIIYAQKHNLETNDILPMVIEEQVKKPATRRVDEIPEVQHGEVSHYAENRMPISQATWRERAHIRGTVSSIRTAPSGGSPRIEVEVWDESGGITLQFIGRRSIVGLDVGSTICAEGMVGEDEGALTILNPSYELII